MPIRSVQSGTMESVSTVQPEPSDVQPSESMLGQSEVVVHRSPRYNRFMIVGAVIGAIVAFVLTMTAPAGEEYSVAQVLGFLTLGCVAAGVALAAILALVLDRMARKRTAVAEHIGHQAE